AHPGRQQDGVVAVEPPRPVRPVVPSTATRRPPRHRQTRGRTGTVQRCYPPGRTLSMRYFFGLAVLLLLASLVSGITQVRPGERVVVRRFGRVVGTPGPGLWIGLPWGMERIDRVPVDLVRRVPVGYRPEEDEASQGTPSGQLLTGDHNLVNVQVIIHY